MNSAAPWRPKLAAVRPPVRHTGGVRCGCCSLGVEMLRSEGDRNKSQWFTYSLMMANAIVPNAQWWFMIVHDASQWFFIIDGAWWVMMVDWWWWCIGWLCSVKNDQLYEAVPTILGFMGLLHSHAGTRDKEAMVTPSRMMVSTAILA